VLPPSSGKKSSSILKMKAAASTETSITTKLHIVTSQKMVIFLIYNKFSHLPWCINFYDLIKKGSIVSNGNSTKYIKNEYFMAESKDCLITFAIGE
jgi:hypothetical protein